MGVYISTTATLESISDVYAIHFVNRMKLALLVFSVTSHLILYAAGY